VYQEGDDPDEIYFISRGRVNFVVCLQDIRFKSILEGSYFGDVEMFLSSKRLCTCKIVYQTELLVMSKPVISIQMMKYITEEFPEISNEMMELALKRKSKILEAKEEMEKVLINVDRYAFTRARERKMSTVVMRVPPNFFKKESQSQGSSRQVLPMDF
jgi:CRP-like cAMP-binding protein